MIDVLISMTVLGILVPVLVTVFIVIIRTVPTTEVRIDDARATRGLATWLAHDTTSAPPYLPVQAEGGIDLSPAANSCGSIGANVAHLSWLEEADTTKTFVANYRFVDDGTHGSVVRVTCSWNGVSWTPGTEEAVASGLGRAPVAFAVPVWNAANTEVISLTFHLYTPSGELVTIEHGSQNPAEFY